MEEKKKWYQTSLAIVIFLVFFFPVGIFLMWKHANWNKKAKWIVSGFFAFLIVISVFSDTSKSTTVSNKQESATTSDNAVQPTTVPATQPKSIVEPTVVSKKITEKINNLVVEKYPNFEVTIWNKNSELASEGEIPYEVIINGSFNKTIASSCDGAKRLSYYMLETFYKDSEIRPTLSRVMITIPYYLRVSLGASDGVPMAQGSGFSGPTNFWTVVEKAGLGEDESGEMKNRSWGTYLTKCE